MIETRHANPAPREVCTKIYFGLGTLDGVAFIAKPFADRSARLRRDFLAPDRYGDSDIQRQARKLALATAAGRQIDALSLIVGLAAVLEVTQRLIPGRHSQLVDWMAGSFGAGAGVVLVILMERLLTAVE
jgi:hypothetical protein